METNNNSAVADTNAKPPRNIGSINFDSKDEAAIEIPNEAERES